MLNLVEPKNLFAVRVRYRDRFYERIEETIALATTDREVGEAIRKWYRKHTEDEGGLTWDNVELAKDYVVYFDAIESDGTINHADWREGAEFTVYDKFV